MTFELAKEIITLSLASNYFRAGRFAQEIFEKQAERLLSGHKKLPDFYPEKWKLFIQKIVLEWETLDFDETRTEYNQLKTINKKKVCQPPALPKTA
jgi:hypothetical protein